MKAVCFAIGLDRRGPRRHQRGAGWSEWQGGRGSGRTVCGGW